MPLDPKGIYLGFDPGGDRKFGVALLKGDCVSTSTVSNVDEAMKWADNACISRLPIAAGIDTLLHWATSKGGMRPCDLQLRTKYRRIKNSIVAPNSLRGAMAIGGMASAFRFGVSADEKFLTFEHLSSPLIKLSFQSCNTAAHTADTPKRYRTRFNLA